MDIITCPEIACSDPAEVIDRWAFPSTGGGIEHIKTRCLSGHVRTPRVSSRIRAELDHQVPQRDRTIG